MCVMDTLTAREQSFGSIKLVEYPNGNSCRLKLKEKVCHESNIQRNGLVDKVAWLNKMHHLVSKWLEYFKK